MPGLVISLVKLVNLLRLSLIRLGVASLFLGEVSPNDCYERGG